MSRKSYHIFFFLWLLLSSFSSFAIELTPSMRPNAVLAKQSLALDIPLIAKVTNATVFPNGSFCVDISVENFNDIVSVQFSMGWGDPHLQFDSIVVVTSPFPDGLVFDETLTDVGLLTVSGDHPIGLGNSLADGTVLFRLCFTVIGVPGDCTTVAFTGFPLGIEVTQQGSGGTDIGMDGQNGTVCIVEPLISNPLVVSQLNCNTMDEGSIELNAMGGTSPYSYLWAGPSNFSASTPNLTNLSAGTYWLTLTDASDPALTLLDTFQITGNFTSPQLSVTATSSITCLTPSLSLTTQLDNNGDPYTLDWSTTDGHFESGQDELEPIVDQGGTYQLIVTNTLSNCVDTASITVLENIQIPVVTIAPPATLNCLQTTVTLDGFFSSTGNSFLYEWTTADGLLQGNIASLQVDVESPGTYQLLVSDIINGCQDSSFVVVNQNIDTPILEFSGTTFINCNFQNALLKGVHNSLDSMSYNWTTTDGQFSSPQNNRTVFVNGAGLYQLIARNELSFCSDTLYQTVMIDTLSPNVSIDGMDVLNCVQTSLILEGQNGFTDSTIVYTWSSLDGQFLTDTALPTVEINQAGTYQLHLKTESNGCEDSTAIQIVYDNSSLLAQTMDDFSLCENFAAIEANQPDGTAGTWTTLGDAMIGNPDLALSEVEDLIEGDNVLVWTLSTPACPMYDADTLIVNLETLPIAQDDAFAIPPLPLPQPLNLIGNDGINVTDNWELHVLSVPVFGSLSESLPGVLTFDNPDSEIGVIEFSYELCNTVCVNLCDSALVQLQIQKELLIDSTLLIPSGITANGDGVNDLFFIPFLETNSDEFPNNELIVFNRWGDVVYQAKPYLNNWDGRSNSGSELPQGTYYYLLRLSLANGIIYRGAITILK